ncbi:MAG: acyl-CoA desaturase [Cyclobacteriaceae bacterium]
MSKPAVKFKSTDQPEFFKVLRSRVNDHFKEKDISRHANVNMVLKTTFMIGLYFTPFVLMLTGVVTGAWPIFAMWLIMGFGMSGIGLSIMHDACHGSYSSNARVNKFIGFILNFIGGYPMNWRIQHNVLHHTYTNVEGYDEDIDKKGLLRLSPNQPHNSANKYQAFYAPFLYGLMTFYWLVAKDFDQLKRYSQMDLVKPQGTTTTKALIEIIFNKTWYLGLTVVLPFMVLDVAWWVILGGFFTMQFICGLILAFIFQPAHVIPETQFFIPDENNSVENNWAIHQLLTTANFANGSTVFSWLVGGLNYQIEHHLFPNICHVHYRDLSKIVKQTAQEFNIPYYHHKTFFSALRQHFALLNDLGAGKGLEEVKVAA